jgi:hypothetical protein
VEARLTEGRVAGTAAREADWRSGGTVGAGVEPLSKVVGMTLGLVAGSDCSGTRLLRKINPSKFFHPISGWATTHPVDPPLSYTMMSFSPCKAMMEPRLNHDV